jgi:hypothetical protein
LALILLKGLPQQVHCHFVVGKKFFASEQQAVYCFPANDKPVVFLSEK